MFSDCVLYILLIIFIGFIQLCNAKVSNRGNDVISCKDEQGNNVDWFYLYKLPVQYSNPKDKTKKGLEFLYFTPKSIDWALSNRTIDDIGSAVGQTLQQGFIDVNNPNRFVVAYNDEPPTSKTDGSNGHTKGVLIGNDHSGIWLIHSVPLFPILSDDPSEYIYPETGRTYGQSFLCISVSSDQLDSIGKQLMYNEAHVYDFKITNTLAKQYPNIVRAGNREKIKTAPFWNELTFQSVGGVTFRSFAKSRHFEKELYEDWVAPVLDSDLYVETWRHGTGIMPSNCTKSNRVWNISEIKVNIIPLTFRSLADHSKWTVSTDKFNWICVGDINRAEHQKKRGGGTVCQTSEAISKVYRELIHSFEPCPQAVH